MLLGELINPEPRNLPRFWTFLYLSSNVSTINTYVGSDGKLHFTNSAGADSVLPFSSGKTVVNLGNGTSFNVSSYSGYKNFTVNNFIVGISSVYAYSWNQQVAGQNYNYYTANCKGATVGKSYNTTNGIWMGAQSFSTFAYLIY